MSKKLTNDEFIDRVKLIHSDYDYSMVTYKSLSTKIKVLDVYKNEHLIRPDSLLVGNRLNIKSVINKEKYLINFFNQIHDNKFNYEKLTYISSDNKIVITCKIHGNFTQTIHNHLKGKGCPKCNGKNRTTEDIINDFIKTHGEKYDYSKVNYSGVKTKVKIVCPIHGEFEQSPEEHINGCGCPVCRESRGERQIRLFLIENNIKFIPQHKFDDCKYILKLPFDFYLPDHNVCIEFNGEQHYKPVKFFGGVKNFELTLKRDKIKENYCIKNSIKLIVIPFNQQINKKLFLLV